MQPECGFGRRVRTAGRRRTALALLAGVWSLMPQLLAALMPCRVLVGTEFEMGAAGACYGADSEPASGCHWHYYCQRLVLSQHCCQKAPLPAGARRGPHDAGHGSRWAARRRAPPPTESDSESRAAVESAGGTASLSARSSSSEGVPRTIAGDTTLQLVSSDGNSATGAHAVG